MVSLFQNTNSVSAPPLSFGAVVWILCTLFAWGSKLLKYDIGIIGVVCWIVSLVGIFLFLLYAFLWVYSLVNPDY